MATHVGSHVWPSNAQIDQRFAWNSLATVVFVVLVTLLSCRRRDGRSVSSSLSEHGA